MDDLNTQAADLIERAMGVLDERGWCQNALEDDGGRVCLVGAIQAVRPRSEHAWGALWGTAWGALCQQASTEGLFGPVVFNNAPSTTVEDVLLAMKRAAHVLRESSS